MNESYKSILTKNGIAIQKKNVDVSTLQRLRKQMTVKPFCLIGDKSKFPIYLESMSSLYVPRYYPLPVYLQPTVSSLELGERIETKFIGTLREKQKKILNKFSETFKGKHPGGIISVRCGGGKTVIALNIISCLKRKTLVVVHKRFLLNQWKKRIQEFLTNVTVGFIYGNTCNDGDIVIAMLQSLSKKEYSPKIMRSFGCCIVDECHHIGAEVFSQALPKIHCKVMLGLSATPKRQDGLSKVFEWWLGPYIYKENFLTNTCLNVCILNTPCVYSTKRKELSKVYCELLEKITNDSERTKMIAKLIKNIYEAKRHVLVLSHRRKHLTRIHSELSPRLKAETDFYVGGRSALELDVAASRRIILATFSMSAEGMDIPNLNTLILATPKSTVIQSVGRIQRKKNIIVPTVFDLLDDHSMLRSQLKKRKREYKKLGSSVSTTQNWNGESHFKNPIIVF